MPDDPQNDPISSWKNEFFHQNICFRILLLSSFLIFIKQSIEQWFQKLIQYFYSDSRNSAYEFQAVEIFVLTLFAWEKIQSHEYWLLSAWFERIKRSPSPRGNWILFETKCNFFNQRNDETGFFFLTLPSRNAIRVHCHTQHQSTQCEVNLMNCVH